MDGRSQEIERLAEHFAEGPSIFTTSPLYQSFCKVIAQEQSILELLTQRQTGQQASYLLFGAIHYLLLNGVQHPLRDFYPSLVKEVTASPGEVGPVLLDFCCTYCDELEEIIRMRLVQTNVVKRSVGLLVALRAVRMRGVERVHLIEVGTSAGIHLHVDRYRYLIGGRVFGKRDAKVVIETLLPTLTAHETHPKPFTATELLSFWQAEEPENQREAEQLSAALESVATDPPTIIAGDAIDVCPTLSKRLPPGEARIVFHAATRMHVPIERRAAFDAAIDTIGEDGPLYHIWQEPPFAPHAGMPSDPRGVLALHGPGDDQPVSLAQVSGHLDWIVLLDG